MTSVVLIAARLPLPLYFFLRIGRNDLDGHVLGGDDEAVLIVARDGASELEIGVVRWILIDKEVGHEGDQEARKDPCRDPEEAREDAAGLAVAPVASGAHARSSCLTRGSSVGPMSLWSSSKPRR